MSPQFFYTDREGKRWSITNVSASDLPGFYSVDRSDGKRVVIYRQELQVDQSSSVVSGE